MNALDLFDAMLRDRVAPELRQLGMRGSGQRFSVPNSNGDYALLGFQKSPHNTPDECQFTASAAFCSHAGWQQTRALHAWLPATPSATTFYPFAPMWQERVGALLDPPYDRWWAIRTADDVTAVAEQVIAAVRDAVLPQLLARLTETEPPPLPERPDQPERSDRPGAGTENLDRAPALDDAEQAALASARAAAVPRTRAWKVLRISRRRLDSYADRIGAGPELIFTELLTVSMLAYGEMLAPEHWPAAAAVVGAWAEQLPVADAHAALVVGENQVAMLPFAAALTLDDPAFGNTIIQWLMDATRSLLEELGSGRASSARAI